MDGRFILNILTVQIYAKEQHQQKKIQFVNFKCKNIETDTQLKEKKKQHNNQEPHVLCRIHFKKFIQRESSRIQCFCKRKYTRFVIKTNILNRLLFSFVSILIELRRNGVNKCRSIVKMKKIYD